LRRIPKEFHAKGCDHDQNIHTDQRCQAENLLSIKGCAHKDKSSRDTAAAIPATVCARLIERDHSGLADPSRNAHTAKEACHGIPPHLVRYIPDWHPPRVLPSYR